MLALCLMLATAAAPAPAHAEWTALLKTYVHSGEVDYRGLKEHAAVLNGYLRTLVAVKRTSVGRSRTATIARRRTSCFPARM